MEIQKVGTLESNISSLDGVNAAPLVAASSPVPGVVFEESAVKSILPPPGVKPTEAVPNKGWDTMQRRGTHLLDTRDAEKLLKINDAASSSKKDPLGQSKGKSPFPHSFLQVDFLDWAVVSVSVVLLSILFNECSTALAYSNSIKVGVKALDDHDLKAAKQAFSAGIMASPDSSEAHYLKALCNISDNDIDESIKELDKSIELDHNNAKARLTRATLSLKKRKYHDAVKDCSAVLALNPNDVDALRIRATAYTHQQLFSKTVEDANAFLSLYPVKDDARAEVLSKRAFAFDQQRSFALSIKDYTEAIKCDPKNEQYFVDRAIVRMHDKQWKNAIADCNAALLMDSAIAAAYKVRGHCFDMLGNHGKALKDFDKLVDLHSTIDTRRMRGIKRWRANDLLGSLEDFDYVLEQDPADAATAAKYQRAKEILQAKANRNAQRFAAPVPQRTTTLAAINVADKSNGEVISKGYELLMNGRSAEAIQYLEASVRSNPNNGKARRFLAYAFLQSGRAVKAVEQFAAQEALEPLKRTDKLAYASALTKVGDHEDSLRIYSELISDNARDDFARVAAIKLLMKDGEKEQARSLASTGMQVSPEYRKLYRSLTN